MGSVQIVSTVLAAAVTIVAVALAARAVTRIVRVIRLGQPDPERLTDKGARTKTMLTETVGHTRWTRPWPRSSSAGPTPWARSSWGPAASPPSAW